MEFYDEKDMKYWQKQSELGRAVIIKIPVSMLLDLDISSLAGQKVRPLPLMISMPGWIRTGKRS